MDTYPIKIASSLLARLRWELEASETWATARLPDDTVFEDICEEVRRVNLVLSEASLPLIGIVPRSPRLLRGRKRLANALRNRDRVELDRLLAGNSSASRVTANVEGLANVFGVQLVQIDRRPSLRRMNPS